MNMICDGYCFFEAKHPTYCKDCHFDKILYITWIESRYLPFMGHQIVSDDKVVAFALKRALKE